MAKQPKRPSSGRRPVRPGRNSTTTERVQVTLRQRLMNRRVVITSGIFLAALVVALGAIFLFYKVYADPQRVFWSTVNNNLATNGVSKQTISSQSGTLTSEITQMVFSPNLKIHDLKTATSQSTNSQVTLETIGTVNADYERYSKIIRPGAKTSQADYQKIYDMWLKNGGASTGSAEVINNAIFGAVLFGNLNNAQRAQLLTMLKGTYVVDFANVNKQTVAGRRTYVYQVLVPLKKYAAAAHAYATFEGLPVANQIDPANYNDSNHLQIKITVDVLSRQIKRIDYAQQNLTETYTGYGIQPEVNPPTHIVDSTQFENVINSIIK